MWIRAICAIDVAFFARLLLPHIVRDPFNRLHRYLMHRRRLRAPLPPDLAPLIPTPAELAALIQSLTQSLSPSIEPQSPNAPSPNFPSSDTISPDFSIFNAPSPDTSPLLARLAPLAARLATLSQSPTLSPPRTPLAPSYSSYRSYRSYPSYSPSPLPTRRGGIDVTLAPRGAAKSSLVSLIFPLHAILHRSEDYIVLVSATQRQAAQRLANLRAELLDNPVLRFLYPELAQTVTRRNAASLEANGVRVDAFGAGAELRGISHRGQRPTWIILDDVERTDTIHSPAARHKLAAWFDQVVDLLGAPATNIDVIGTLLHRDALPVRLARRPDVSSKAFAALEAEPLPASAGLWTAWRTLYHDFNNPERLAAAQAYFQANRPAMSAGARVLWPAREPLYRLATLRENLGRAAFEQEKQNNPAAAPGTIFRLEHIRRFRIENETLILDPAPPLAGSADLPIGQPAPSLHAHSSSHPFPFLSSLLYVLFVP